MANTKSLKSFSTTNQPKTKNGRKKNDPAVKKYIKDNNISRRDVESMCKIFLASTKKEIDNILTDENAPFMMRSFAKAFFSDFRKSDLKNFFKLIEMTYGKKEIPKEVDELNNKKEVIHIYMPDNGRYNKEEKE